MRGTQLATALRSAALVLRSAQMIPAASDVDQLAVEIAKVRSGNIKTLFARLPAGGANRYRDADLYTIGELADLIDKCREAFARDFKKASLERLGECVELLRGLESTPVAHLTKALSDLRRLSAEAKKRSPKSLRSDLVDRYSKLLADVGLDEQAFASALRELSSDKSVRALELNAIVRSVTGTKRVFSKKADAEDAIVIDFYQRLRAADKAERIKKLAG